MKRLVVLSLYELGEVIADLSNRIHSTTITLGDIYVPLTKVERSLSEFVRSQSAFGLSLDVAENLRVTVSGMIQKTFYVDESRENFKEGLDFSDEIPRWYFFEVTNRIDKFKHVFAAECGRSEIYSVEQKMGYDISSLLHDAEKNIHADIRHLISDNALTEVRDAGRCFALENYTASGFHILRALEVVMGDYYKKVGGEDKEFRSWFDYTKEFEKLVDTREGRQSEFPSPKVVSMLDRMRQLDRNPLMHPRDSLDEMAADTLFKLGVVTITELAKDMREMTGQLELVPEAEIS